MAYIHCHKCSWSQDDFYDESGYNPAKVLKNWNEALCSDKVNKIFPGKIITYKEVIAQEYERKAKNIRNMKWTTFQQYKNDPNKQCPMCGNGLCID